MCMIQSHRVATATHPVHAGTLSPSSKNCKGCPRLRWEEIPADLHFIIPASRRRVCMWFDPPRIPGNIRCPLTESEADQEE